MAEKVIVNERWSLKALDFLKGAIMAIGTPVLILLQELIPQYDIHIIWKAAISAGITYLLKNLVSDPSVKTVYKSNTHAVEVGETIKTNK